MHEQATATTITSREYHFSHINYRYKMKLSREETDKEKKREVGGGVRGDGACKG